MGTRLFWPFEDPAAFDGPEGERLEKFREVRDSIEARIREWLSET
jgi:arsenate reductase